MRYDNLRAFVKHLEGAAPNHFSSIYVILGKEPFECHEALQLLQNFLIPKKYEVAIKQWDANFLSNSQLVMELGAYSFFSNKRLFYITHADKLKKSVQEELEKYFKNPAKENTLIFSASQLSRQSQFYKLLEKEGVILEFADLKPWDKEKRLIEWVGKKTTQARKIMNYQVCTQFVKMIGLDYYTISNELEKLFCYIGDNKDITWSDVKDICTVASTESVWQLGEAIFVKNTAKALEIFQALLKEGQVFLQILRQLRSQFVTSFHIANLLAQAKTPADITQEYPYMKGQILEKNMHNARHYGLKSFQQGLLEIDATELNTKNLQIDEQLLAELLIIKLTR